VYFLVVFPHDESSPLVFFLCYAWITEGNLYLAEVICTVSVFPVAFFLGEEPARGGGNNSRSIDF
jgi:hypothetical protein